MLSIFGVLGYYMYVCMYRYIFGISWRVEGVLVAEGKGKALSFSYQRSYLFIFIGFYMLFTDGIC